MRAFALFCCAAMTVQEGYGSAQLVIPLPLVRVASAVPLSESGHPKVLKVITQFWMP